jgi:hypothetical protein
MKPRELFGLKLFRFIGVVFFFLSLLIMIIQWENFRNMPDRPIPIQLSTLNRQIMNIPTNWILLEDGHWDCDSIRITGFGRNTQTTACFIGEGKNVVYGTFSGELTCGDLVKRPATGTIGNMNNRMQANLKKENPYIARLSDDTNFYELCTFCGPNNSKAGIVVGFFLMAASLIIILYSRQELRKWEIQILG